MHNIGLIARSVCSNKTLAKKIHAEILGVASDLWKSNVDVVTRNIACCLWRGEPNLLSYKHGLTVNARAK